MSDRIWNRTLVATAALVALASAASIGSAWSASGNLATRVTIVALVPIVGAAALSYSLRVLRFHYFLVHSGVSVSLLDTLVVQCIGFALAVTPGHLGEVFKLHLIRERSGVPVVQTAPILVLDRLTEGGGFAILALASGAMLPAMAGRVPPSAWLLPGLGVAIALVASRRWNVDLGRRILHALPPRLVQRLAPHGRNLWLGMQASLKPRQILGGLILSVCARFADGLVVLFVAQTFGVGLSPFQAIFVLAMSGLAGGISFLPGGTGAVEATMVALLVLTGATWANALAITLVARLCTLWLWVALGLALALLSRVPRVNALLGGNKRF